MCGICRNKKIGMLVFCVDVGKLNKDYSFNISTRLKFGDDEPFTYHVYSFERTFNKMFIIWLRCIFRNKE
jgi:hypothetical protein